MSALPFPTDAASESLGGMPCRSVLHQLQPEGVGTPTCETLHSYMQRLARSHQVTSYQLATFICQARMGIFATATRLPLRLDSLCENVAEFTSRLAILTQLPSVNLIGLSWLHGRVAPNEKLKSKLPWCRKCLLNARDAGKPVYGQTAWLFSNSRKCLVHDEPLVELCPRCGTGKDPRLVINVSALDLCGECGCDLAEHQSADNLVRGNMALSNGAWDTYAATQIGELISSAPQIAVSSDGPDLHRLYRSAMDRGRASSVRMLGELAGTGLTVGRFCQADSSLPTVDILLRLSVVADVSLAGVLCPALWREDNLQVPFGDDEGRQRKRRLRAHDWTAIRQRIQQALRDEEDISIESLSRELEIRQAVLLFKLGDLGRAVTRHKRLKLADRQQQDVDALVARMENLSKTYSYFQQRLSMTGVSRELEVSRDSSLLKAAWRQFNDSRASLDRRDTLFPEAA